MNKNPSPVEFLRMVQKIDPSVTLLSIPNVGNIYHSHNGNFGFSIAIDPETLELKASVSQMNCNVQSEKMDSLSLDQLLDWIAESFKDWKEIPVEGRTKGRYELFLESGGQKIDFDDSILEPEDNSDLADESLIVVPNREFSIA